MENIHVCLVQADLVWEDPRANRKKFDQLLSQVARPVDVIILPEMFTTGFSMHPSTLAESMGGTTIQWMKEKAVFFQSVVTGSLIIAEGGAYYNRLVWVRPNGAIEWYDKRHLFVMAGEDAYYRAGDKRVIFEYKSWRICPQICYDLRFPVWSRNVELYDVLLYVANWPDRRISDWDVLLRARAIENQAYVIAVNRCGTDGVGLEYSGHSTIVDPAWRGVMYVHEGGEHVYQYTLDYAHLKEVRRSLPFLADRDTFEIR